LSIKPTGQKSIKLDRIQIPNAPAIYYDIEYDSQADSRVKRPEPVMHVKSGRASQVRIN